ncbi:hypothetical protein WUBG_14347, partial [Wuchereria bancrofti]
EVLSGPSSYLQKPKYLSLQRIRDLFAVGDKLTIIGELESVFSSLSSINASFLYENEKKYRCSASNSCLDLDHVVQASSIISENIDADQYAEIMLASLDAAGMWELSWEKISCLESLRIYLILPSLSVYLEKWWSLFERRHFNRLVSALVKALEQLVEHEPNNTSNVIPFCSILSRLNAINRSQKLIAYDKFYLHNLQKKVDMANDLAGWEFNAQHDVFYWSNYPFLLNADLKTYLLQLEAHIQMQISMSTSGIMILPFNISLQPHPFFELSVHRDNIVDDAMIALLSSK